LYQPPSEAGAFRPGLTRPQVQENQFMLKIGDKAPEFNLASDGGKQLALKDFKGRRVLLFFFPRANTPG
jgi:peroxiredoxin